MYLQRVSWNDNGYNIVDLVAGMDFIVYAFSFRLD